MLENAKRQLKDITMPQIEALLKEMLGHLYDKILIEQESFVRENYVFSKVDYEIADRKAYGANFILKSSIDEIFSLFENNRQKINPFPTNDILKYTKKRNLIYVDEMEMMRIPFNVENGQVCQDQIYYYLSDCTYREACRQCIGNKKVTCSKCSGNKMLECDKCDGEKKITCSNCDGKMWIRCGSGFFSVGCGGSGKDNSGKRCKECKGEGEIKCKKCIRGEVKCDRCRGNGRIQCDKCRGNGVVNCRECDANGYFGNIGFIETKIVKKSHSKFITPIDKNYLSEKLLLKHIKDMPTQIVYKNVNNDKIENYDTFNLSYSVNFQNELGLEKICFPLILQEKIFYQFIPCVRIRYTHILTNEEHELSIINFFDNPEIIYHSNPEKVKINFNSIFKTIRHFFEKLFKTQNYLNREDQYKEVALIIYLAKADGIIVEAEKIHLTEVINNLSDFTNAQRKALFNLLNTSTLPELSEKDLTFNNTEKAQEIFAKLNELANVDNNASIEEKILLDKFSKQIDKNDK